MKVASRPASCTHAYVCSQHQLRNDPKSKPCPRRASYGLKNLTVRQPLRCISQPIARKPSPSEPFAMGAVKALPSGEEGPRSCTARPVKEKPPGQAIRHSLTRGHGSIDHPLHPLPVPTRARRRSGAGVGRPSCRRPGRWCGRFRPWRPGAMQFPRGL